MTGEQAKDEIAANIPLVESIFFEIHGSELKPDPAKVTALTGRNLMLTRKRLTR